MKIGVFGLDYTFWGIWADLLSPQGRYLGTSALRMRPTHVWDKNVKKAQDFATQWGCQVVDRYDGMVGKVDAVLNGRVDNVFCAVRPPGHHAGKNSAMGFCFINNVAVGAVYARAIYGVDAYEGEIRVGETLLIFRIEPTTAVREGAEIALCFDPAHCSILLS